MLQKKLGPGIGTLLKGLPRLHEFMSALHTRRSLENTFIHGSSDRLFAHRPSTRFFFRKDMFGKRLFSKWCLSYIWSTP
jgi:hypothetical protein